MNISKRINGFGLISFSVILLFWEVVGFGDSLFPPPSKVFQTFFILWSDGVFIKDVLASLYRLSIGFFFGTIVGVFLGIMMGYFHYIRSFLFPVISFIITIPKIALLPIFIVLLGVGEESKIAIISLGAFFPAVMTSFASVQRTPIALLEAGLNLGCDKISLLYKVVLPHSLPNIINSGFRLSISIGLVLLVASEMIASQHGLGNFVYYTGTEFKFDKMFAGLITLGTIGLACNKLIDILMRFFCKWSIESEGGNYERI